MCQACSQSVSQVTHLCPLYRRVVHHVTSDTNGGEASTGTRTQAKLTTRNPAMVEVIMERGRCQGRNPNVSRAPSQADVKSSRPGCGVPLRRSSIVEPYRLRKHVHGSIPARHMPRDTLCRSEVAATDRVVALLVWRGSCARWTKSETPPCQGNNAAATRIYQASKCTPPDPLNLTDPLCKRVPPL